MRSFFIDQIGFKTTQTKTHWIHVTQYPTISGWYEIQDLNNIIAKNLEVFPLWWSLGLGWGIMYDERVFMPPLILLPMSRFDKNMRVFWRGLRHPGFQQNSIAVIKE